MYCIPYVANDLLDDIFKHMSILDLVPLRFNKRSYDIVENMMNTYSGSDGWTERAKIGMLITAIKTARKISDDSFDVHQACEIIRKEHSANYNICNGPWKYSTQLIVKYMMNAVATGDDIEYLFKQLYSMGHGEWLFKYITDVLVYNGLGYVMMTSDPVITLLSNFNMCHIVAKYRTSDHVSSKCGTFVDINAAKVIRYTPSVNHLKQMNDHTMNIILFSICKLGDVTCEDLSNTEYIWTKVKFEVCNEKRLIAMYLIARKLRETYANHEIKFKHHPMRFGPKNTTCDLGTTLVGVNGWRILVLMNEVLYID